MLRAPALLYERPAKGGEFFIKQGSLEIEFNSKGEKEGERRPKKDGDREKAERCKFETGLPE
jgi:hypothetical protein